MKPYGPICETFLELNVFWKPHGPIFETSRELNVFKGIKLLIVILFGMHSGA